MTVPENTSGVGDAVGGVVKVTLYARPDMLLDALLACQVAMRSGSYSDGLAAVQRGNQFFSIWRDRTSFTVWRAVPETSDPKGVEFDTGRQLRDRPND